MRLCSLAVQRKGASFSSCLLWLSALWVKAEKQLSIWLCCYIKIKRWDSVQQFLRNAAQGLVSVHPYHSGLGLMQVPCRESEWISIHFSPNTLYLPHSGIIMSHPLSNQNQDPGPIDIHNSSFSRSSGDCIFLLTISNYYYPGTQEFSQKALLNVKRISAETVVKKALSFCLFKEMPLILFLRH